LGESNVLGKRSEFLSKNYTNENFVTNFSSDDEMNIVVEKDKMEGNVYVKVDDSFASKVKEADIEKEGSEDDSILSSDGE
jgi:hypothetical protein